MPHRGMKFAAQAVLAATSIQHESVLHRHTRIVATIGPASRDPEVLAKLVAAGVDVVRLNFSHGTAEEHLETAKRVREAAAAAEKHVAVMCDLQGPKIRVGAFAEDPGTGKCGTNLVAGQGFTLDTARAEPGDKDGCCVDYDGLPGDVRHGDMLLLNDGLISLEVMSLSGSVVSTRVVHGGWLSGHKGINKAHGGLTAPALTHKDLEDIETAAQMGADYVAVSFPKDAADMRHARELLDRAALAAGCPHVIRTVAKVERAEAVADLDGVILASDAVMVARGDLGVEIGQASVPAVQKRMVRRARELGRPVIVATQLMESMIENPVPTRAEVSDVANAVLDGADAVMLSAESASGKFPVEAVEWLHKVCLEAESATREERAANPYLHGVAPLAGGRSSPRGHHDHSTSTSSDTSSASDDAALRHTTSRAAMVSGRSSVLDIDHGIALGALFTAMQTGCRTICCVTSSGETALRMSRRTTDVPIVAATVSEATARRAALFGGVTPIVLEEVGEPETVIHRIRDHLIEKGLVRRGDRFGVTYGEPVGVEGGTNVITIRTA